MLKDEREWGETFAPEEICWFDFESKNRETPISDGTYKYAVHGADAIVLAYAIGDGPERSIAVPDFSRALRWADVPKDLREHYAKARAGTAVFAAWNAGFDKAIWNLATEDFPVLEPDWLIDVMVQATASGLPPDLETAAKQSRSEHKVNTGSGLIKLFCMPPPDTPYRRKDKDKPRTPLELQIEEALEADAGRGTPQMYPDLWKEFCQVYAIGDITAMRSIFRGTRQLPLAEWREYQAMEKVNERGVAIDLPLVYRAAKMATEDKKRSAHELKDLTNGAVTTVDQVKRLGEWLMRRLQPTGQEMMIKREEEVDDNGIVLRPPKLALTRPRVERLVAYISKLIEDCTDNVMQEELLTTLRVLQIRQFGGGKLKFAKMLQQHVDGKLFGSYVFNGAPQTGRASSKGVQIHNLMRVSAKYEHPMIEAVLNDCSYDQLALLGDNTPVSRKLSTMTRACFKPEGDRVFVWSDWSAIELRVTPWLAGNDPGALERLDIFREVDNDPRQDKRHPDNKNRVRDIYERTAAKIMHLPVEKIDKDLRQRGKIVELALTFLGGVGALQSMAAGYGMHIDDTESKRIVDTWRASNQWAVNFGGRHDDDSSIGLWGAFNRALENPGTTQTAGRISYIFIRGYLGGSMFCVLPSGRCLIYRAVKFERVADLDDDDNVIGWSTKLRYSRGHSRVAIWRGILVENVTQATAADFLRGSLRRAEDEGFYTRIQTHDEILAECEEHEAYAVRDRLRELMCRGFDWSEGLPLHSEETICYYYTKDESVYGINEPEPSKQEAHT